MHQTPRIRVLSDRIPWVLVCVYFYRGLLENMEGRPTRRVYLEILMCAVVFLNLEDSRRTWAKAEPGWALSRVPALGLRAPALPWRLNTLRLVDYATSPLRIKENRVIKVGLIQRPMFHWGGYISKASPPQGRRRNHYQRKPSKLGFRILLSRRELELATVGYFKRKQKNPQAHGYWCSFHPGVFQSINFPQGTWVY